MKRILIGVPLVGLSCCVVFGQATLYSLDGQTMGANSGSAVANAGDVNNDGFDDVILGAPNDLNGAGMASGTASVISGVDGATVWHFEGASAGDGFGGVVAGVGDLNGDSFDEVAVSASGFAGSTGQVLVYDGQTGTVMRTFNGRGVNDFFGVALASVGDLNADGLPDIAIGALGFDPQGPDFGMVQVYSGRTGVLLLTLDGAPNDSLGAAVDGLGDVNGDSIPDFVVGLPSFLGLPPVGGSARIISGSDGSVIHSWRANLTYGASNLGHRVAGIGDVNDDSIPDVAVGNFSASPPGYPLNIGEVSVFSGANGHLLYSVLGRNQQDRFGFSLDGVGDIDGDGRPDWIAGAPSGSTVFPEAGEARVYSGVNGVELINLQGSQLGSGFGSAVAGGLDVNSDGRPDLVVGANLHSEVAFRGGRTNVYLGGLSTLATFHYCQSGVNSLGKVTTLNAIGSQVASDNDFLLQARDVPSQQFIFFLVSRGQDQINNPGGSAGSLCLGGGQAIGRYFSALGQSQADQYHAILDIHAVPEPPTFNSMVMGGETWFFQAWYRDVGGLSNFSTGLGVVFQ